MLEVNIQLYSILRDLLPPDARGRAVLQLEEGSTLADIFTTLEIRHKATVSVNGLHEPQLSRPLNDRDEIKIFASIGGG
jgi:sulfur carrier protein ThiS